MRRPRSQASRQQFASQGQTNVLIPRHWPLAEPLKLGQEDFKCPYRAKTIFMGSGIGGAASLCPRLLWPTPLASMVFTRNNVIAPKKYGDYDYEQDYE